MKVVVEGKMKLVEDMANSGAVEDTVLEVAGRVFPPQAQELEEGMPFLTLRAIHTHYTDVVTRRHVRMCACAQCYRVHVIESVHARAGTMMASLLLFCKHDFPGKIFKIF